MRVLWLLSELELPHEVHRLKLMSGEGYSSEFSKLNPNHTVPVIEYNENDSNTRKVLFESMAIMRFLSMTHLNRFLPSLVNFDSLNVVAEFEQWYTFVGVTMDSALWQIRVLNDFRNDPVNEKDVLEYWIGKYNEVILPQLESQLSDGREFLIKGYGFSIADILLGANLNWAKKYKFLNKPSSTMMVYEKRLRGRKAYKDSVMDGYMFEKDGMGAVMKSKY